MATHGAAYSGEPPLRAGRLRDRADAGRRLAERLASRRLVAPAVLAIPRGGVPVGAEIARRLAAPLDVLLVRKVGAPGDPEYGLGAVGEGGLVRIDEARAREAGFARSELLPVVRAEQAELARRVARFRGGRPALDVRGRTAIVVDDGVATGGTIETAVEIVRLRGPRGVVVALGVAPPEALRRLERLADAVEAALVPAHLEAVGQWYERFDQVDDADVVGLLARGPSTDAAAGA